MERFSKIIITLFCFSALFSITGANAQNQNAAPNFTAQLWMGGAPGKSFSTLYYENDGAIASVDLIASQAIGPLDYRGPTQLVFYSSEESLALPPAERPKPAATVNISASRVFLFFAVDGAPSKLRVLSVPVDPEEMQGQVIKLFNFTSTALMGYVNNERVEMAPGTSRICGPVADNRRGVPVIIFQLAQQDEGSWVRAFENKVLVRKDDSLIMFLYRDASDDVRAVSYRL